MRVAKKLPDIASLIRATVAEIEKDWPMGDRMKADFVAFASAALLLAACGETETREEAYGRGLNDGQTITCKKIAAYDWRTSERLKEQLICPR